MNAIMNDTTIDRLFASDPRIVTVREYLDGWVPNSYKWRATGRLLLHVRDAENPSYVRTSDLTYDRKRSYGRGPAWVAFSAKGGRLVSG